MPKLQTQCPNCGQPITADVNQLIDVGQNPQLKERLLSGQLNVAQCQTCGFQGQLPVPLVYHDPDEELLLTFTPPEMNLSMEEREQKLAPLIQKVTENLPQEERKAYLFQPQTMMTMDSLIKNVLQAEGVTEEMIEEQQERMNLLERLLATEGDEQVALIQKNEDLIDREFFGIFSQIAQRLIASQDQGVIQKIQSLQDNLLNETDVGRKIRTESEAIEEARSALEKAGNNLTRGGLLDMVINAPNEERVRAYASLARPAMDYQFFQMFTDRIEKAEGEKRQKLVKRRNLLLQLTKEIDKQVDQRLKEARERIETILGEENLSEAVMNNISYIDEFFLQALGAELEDAKKNNNAQRLEKLQQLMQVIEEISTPAEFKLIDEFLEVAEDDAKLEAKIQEHSAELNEEFMNNLTGIVGQVEDRLEELQGKEKERQEQVLERLKLVHKKALRHTMEKKFKSN